MSATNDRQGNVPPGPQSDENREEERTIRLRAALDGLDPGRALYVVVSSLLGDSLDRERVVANPDTGEVFGYLLPPWEHHSLHEAARHPSRDAVGDPPLALESALRRFGRCMDPVSTNVGE